MHRRQVDPGVLLSSANRRLIVLVSSALADDPNYIKALQRRATANEWINSWSALSSAQEGRCLVYYLVVACNEGCYDARLQ